MVKNQKNDTQQDQKNDASKGETFFYARKISNAKAKVGSTGGAFKLGENARPTA